MTSPDEMESKLSAMERESFLFTALETREVMPELGSRRCFCNADDFAPHAQARLLEEASPKHVSDDNPYSRGRVI